MKLSDETIEKLKKLGVGIVYLFGSRAQGIAGEKSDYDIGVVFVDPTILETMGSLSLNLKLYEILDNEFPDTINGQRLDLSLLQRANPVLRMSAVQKGIALFQVDPKFRADFEERVFHDYNDYLPLKRQYEEATFKAFR